MRTNLRSLALSTLATACAGMAIGCSSGAATGEDAGAGGTTITVRTVGAGGSVTGTGTDTTSGTGTDTNSGTSTTPGGTGTGSGTTAANTNTNTGTGTGGPTDNNYSCGVPPVYDRTAGLITDFRSVACSAPAPHSAPYCFGSGTFQGEFSAPYAADGCASALPTMAITDQGLTISGSVSGPVGIRFWFEPCAYVHAYNSIQFELANRAASFPAVVSVRTLASTPEAQGGQCKEAVCADGWQNKTIETSSAVYTTAFIYNNGASPAVSYIRNQITGFELKINVPCGTTQPMDFTIRHFIFYNSPYSE